jgi:cellulose synthase operon protein C
MRRLIIAVPIMLIAAGAAMAGWHFLRPRDPLGEARQFLANGNVRAAELVLRSAVQADPSRAEAHFRLGQLQLRLGDPIAAERELRSARDHGWDAAAVLPLLAQAVVGQHRDEEVLRDYRPDGLAPDGAATVLLARAQAQLDLHRPEEATASVDEAMRLAPNSVDAKVAAARLALFRNDRKAAEERVTEALAIDPHGLEALLLQARLRINAGDRPGALASYTAALDQAGAAAPGTVLTIRLARADLLAAMGKDAEARADLDAVLKAQPKQPLANLLSARLLARTADWKGADVALANVGPSLSELPNGDLLLALVKFNLGEQEQAIAAAERQVARTPENLSAIKLLARLEFAQKRPDLAAEALAGASGHLDAEALKLLGAAYAAGGHQAEAEQALKQASALLPDDAQLLIQLAGLEMRQGEAGQAVEALQHALNAEAGAPQAGTAPTEPAALAPAQTSTSVAPPASTASDRPGQPTQAQTAATLVVAALRAGEVDQAVAALERLKEANGNPAQTAFLSGLVKAAQVDFAGARAAFEEAIKLDPKRTDVRLELARTMAAQGDVAGASAQLQQVLAANPTDVGAVTALVNLHLAAGDKDQAIAVAEVAHKAAPDTLQITAELSTLYWANKEPQKALDLLDAAGAGTPGKEAADKALRPLRAQAELALGHRAEAVKILRTLLEEQPNNSQLRRQIADLLAVDNDFAGATGVLRDGLALHPGDPTLVAGLVAVASSQGGPAAAVARAQELARDPAYSGAATLTGDVLMAQGHYAEAASTFHAQLAALPKDDPRAALLQIREAQATAAAGKTEDATAMMRAWLAAHPGNTDAALVLASFDISAQRLPQARTELEAVLAKEPNNPTALNNLAWIRQQQGDLADARSLAARAHLLRPTPQTTDTLGWIVLEQGDVSDALTLLRTAAHDLPSNPAITYHYAAALARDGQKEAAVTRLKELLGNSNVRFDEKPQAAKLLAELQS